jgi:hypothetical protein
MSLVLVCSITGQNSLEGLTNTPANYPPLQRDGQCTEGHLVVSLNDGVLTDAKGRTGYIASNYQFQFDAPAQAGAIYTAGYSMCANNSLALGSSTTFFKCRSGDFWNLYDRSWAPQCEPVQLAVYSCSSTSSGGVAGGAGQIGDGQVVATEYVTTTIVRPIPDGQPQVVTSAVPVPICQIDDGQVQAHKTPCASITYAPKAPATAVPVSQYSDGQIQVTPPAASSNAPPAPTMSVSSGPAPSAPPASGPPPVPSGSAPASKPTPATTAAPPPSSSATIVPSNAGRIEMGSISALVVGIIGAVAFL